MGERHGSELALEIRGYLADRLDLAGDPYWAGRAEVPERILEIAQQTLDAHERFSANLFDEMSASYGVTDSVFSFGFCVRWRRQCVEGIELEPGMVVLDLFFGCARRFTGGK